MDASGRHQWPHWWTHRGRGGKQRHEQHRTCLPLHFVGSIAESYIFTFALCLLRKKSYQILSTSINKEMESNALWSYDDGHCRARDFEYLGQNFLGRQSWLSFLNYIFWFEKTILSVLICLQIQAWNPMPYNVDGQRLQIFWSGGSAQAWFFLTVFFICEISRFSFRFLSIVHDMK